MDQGDEIFDVVDANDQVIGRASRREVHLKGWMHRAVHILVYNSRKELFLQKRALEKDENPGLWDTSAAGHVAAGEDYPASAHRELREELGLVESLEEVMRFPAEPDTLWEHVRLYTCTTDEAIRVNRQEISEGRFWSPADLEKGLNSAPDRFTSTFRLIFRNYIKKY